MQDVEVELKIAYTNFTQNFKRQMSIAAEKRKL
jgi:hypothetical protein